MPEKSRRTGQGVIGFGRRAAIGTGVIGGLAVAATPAGAANFEVNTTNDAAADGCTMAADGCTLRDALADAAANGEADTITFQTNLTGTIDVSTFGELSLDPAGYGVEIIGPGPSDILVSGGDGSDGYQGGEDRALNIYDDSFSGQPVSISGLSFRGATDAGSGGAIISSYAALTLNDVTIYDSVSSYSGGGLAVFSIFDPATIANSTFSGNSTDAAGGGISAGGGIDLDNVTVSDNSVLAGPGAGIARGGGISSNSGLFTISDSLVTGNSVDTQNPDPIGAGNQGAQGGGISVDQCYGYASYIPSVTNTTISDNTASFLGGGFNCPDANDALLIESSRITGNEALGGGGIRVAGGVISNSTIDDNEAASGGGLLITGIEPEVELSSSTVSGNRAVTAPPADAGDVFYGNGHGGGINVGANNGVGLLAENSTIAGNSATSEGGGIATTGFNARERDELSSVIVADNTAAGAPGDLSVETPGVGFVAGFSLIEAPAGAAPTADPAGTNITGTDPSLGGLAANGGPTPTMLPANTSAAIDAGTANQIATDQRGLARTVDAASSNRALSDGTDIGAVEVQDASAIGDDPTGPGASITKGPQDGSVTRQKKPKFEFSAGNGLVFECQVDGAGFDPCTSPAQIGPLSDGDHTFDVRAKVDGGILVGGTDSRSFEVDTRVRNAKVSARKKQSQSGNKIKVAIKAGAGEKVKAIAKGKLTVKGSKQSFKLKKAKKTLKANKTKVLRLVPKKKSDNKKISKLIKSGADVRANPSVKLKDDAGNKVVKKQVVRLRP